MKKLNNFELIKFAELFKFERHFMWSETLWDLVQSCRLHLAACRIKQRGVPRPRPLMDWRPNFCQVSDPVRSRTPWNLIPQGLRRSLVWGTLATALRAFVFFKETTKGKLWQVLKACMICPCFQKSPGIIFSLVHQNVGNNCTFWSLKPL
jgi:hypothetical protein